MGVSIHATSYREICTFNSLSHPLDLDDVFRGEGAPVVLVPRKQLVDARPLLVHEGVDAVLDLPAVLVQLGLMG